MVSASDALQPIPAALRNSLLQEYQTICQNFLERRWSPAELSAGKFCEIVYTILDGYAKGNYPSGPSKPPDFVRACRALESNTGVPRSFQILIPRLLPALYEIRNNRGVGHVGGDVDPNHMDAAAVLSMSNWVMAELVRVLHNLTTEEAQQLVDSLAERRLPLVWQDGNTKRVLDPSLPLKDTILILSASAPGSTNTDSLFRWTGYNKKPYFMRLLRQLHNDRYIELSQDESALQVLPPGSKYVEEIVSTRL